MAAATDAVWALDLGNYSLKALRLMAVGESVQVIGFDNVRHGKVLTGKGVGATERDELIAITLRQFVQRNDIGMDAVVVSVPSQNSFARFVTLPPVEQKRVPEIVRFEAAQQIPFDMSEVQWDWQLMSEADSPEKKVGIFAIKNEVVRTVLEHFEREELPVGFVQMAPMALYNYLVQDRPDLVASDERAVAIVNIGAESTDLVICTASAVWQRCIMMGGNSFTSAIAETFKLSFEKAEKLKRTAPVSKYARQIFQAMRPVFTDLVAEVQRSIGFYTTSNPNVKIARVVAIGGGTRLRGLLKYLQQTLQIPVERPDSFKRLAIAQGVSTAKFHENISDFGVVYGLGLQGLGMARIESNLLPTSVVRSMAWASKTKYFVAAACMFLAVSLLCLGRAGLDKMTYAKSGQTRTRYKTIIRDAEQAQSEVDEADREASTHIDKAKKAFELFKHREVIPLVHQTVMSTIPNEKNLADDLQKQVHQAYAAGDIPGVTAVSRKERKQLFVTSVSIYFSDDLARAQFGSTATSRKGARGRIGGEMEMDEAEMEAIMQEYELMSMAGIDPQQMGYMIPGMAQEGEEKDAGFVVSIAGYSPYKDIGELLDPVGVENNRSQWGVATRLMHLDELAVFDGNSPFALYEKQAVEHFKLDKGPVDLEAEMPVGIGVVDTIQDETAAKPSPVRGIAATTTTGRRVLRDPLTREIISSEPQFDQFGKQLYDFRGVPVVAVRDNWFVLNFKLKWKNAPEIKKASPFPLAGGRR